MASTEVGIQVEVRKKRTGLFSFLGDKTVAKYNVPYGAYNRGQLDTRFPKVAWNEIFNRDVVVFRRSVIVARNSDASGVQEHTTKFSVDTARGHVVRFGVVPERSNTIKNLLHR